tara:strand:+ start:60 stop:173 length:114 start_codon:yes stop_codon:yes gene_type:complete
VAVAVAVAVTLQLVPEQEVIGFQMELYLDVFQQVLLH